MKSSSPSALDALIAKARSEEQKFRRDQLQRKADNAHRKLASLTALRSQPEDHVAQLLEAAKDYRHLTSSVTNKKLAKSFERKAAQLEKRYQLWCDHHGKIPQQRLVQQNQTPPRSHGGRRSGAGRPQAGNVQMLIRLKPKT